MTQFVPHTPENIVTVEITERELIVIEELRKYPFGKITIHKANGVLVRLEPVISILINPKGSHE